MFTGYDPESQKYRGRAHLAEMIRALGPPPHNLLDKSKLNDKLLLDDGKPTALYYPLNSVSTHYPTLLGDLCAETSLKDRISLEERETTLEGQEREAFLRLIRKMLQWEPSKRSSAKELAEDEWIRNNL